jgi:hypothetical protein
MRSLRCLKQSHSSNHEVYGILRMSNSVSESGQICAVRDSDLLRVLVALAGRIAFPPEQLSQIVGPYAAAYNMCTGEVTLASVARATAIDKSNLRKAVLRWEQAGVVFRVGAEGRPMRLYSLPGADDRVRDKSRAASTVDPAELLDGEVDGQ